MSEHWPLVPLSSLLIERQEVPSDDALASGEIPIVAKIGFDNGRIQLRAEGRTKTGMILIRPGDFVVSGINAAKGAIAVYGEDNTRPIAATIHYGAYIPQKERVDISFLWWLLRSRTFKSLLLEHVPGGVKTELKSKRLLPIPIPLPPLQEQQRIVARIESLAAKIDEVRGLREEVQKDLSRLLNAAYHQIADKVPRKPLGELAPLDRRPVTVDFEASYPQVAVRSFGRGAFHKPLLIGSEVTWEKPFLVKAGDILVSNIKAWEGAIAVAGADDDGRVGSHRYLTCVAKPGIATARFVCFHLLTSEGLYEVGEASPGSADRNRTLSAKAFMQIPVPMPGYEKQLWFDALYQKVDSIAKTQSESSPELAALLPSILDKAFKGEL